LTKKRKNYSAKQKSQIALEALKGNQIAAELSSQYGIHPTMISRWKSQLQDGLPLIFSKTTARKEKQNDELISELYQQIGQLKVELDWLKKKSAVFK
jgi:putative transposase